MRQAFRIGFALAGLAALSGCGEKTILSYQGRPAMTALECKAAYEEARRRPATVDYSSNGAAIGTAIGKGIAKGMISSAYDQCLARVAAERPAADLPAATVAAAPAPRAGGYPQSEPYLSMWGRECVPGYGSYQGGLSCPGY